MIMSYKPPETIWEVPQNLKFEVPLEPDDPRLVNTDKARGNIGFNFLLKPLGIRLPDYKLMSRPNRSYNIFCGHRGCGKSTELRLLSAKLNHPDRFFVIFLDALPELDINNLQYVDILMALAKKLFQKLEENSIQIDQVFLTNLEKWFSERIERHEKTKNFAADIKAGASVEHGVPFLAKLFGSISVSFKNDSTYKEELRKVIKNSFSEFADALNQLIVAAEDGVKRQHKGETLLFIIDGADRLSGEDSRRFFISDVHQLQLINSNFIYCAPNSLLYEKGDIRQMFNTFMLPMIKIHDKNSRKKLKNGYEALREMISLRLSEKLFDSPDTIDYLIEYSGGSPRDLFRLLQYAFQFADGEQFDRIASEKAVQQVASDFRRILNADDYQLLHDIDHSDEADHNSDHAREVLYNPALLEYNDFWWSSHPTIRTLNAYKKLGDSKEKS